jgi:hypothetical protein
MIIKHFCLFFGISLSLSLYLSKAIRFWKQKKRWRTEEDKAYQELQHSKKIFIHHWMILLKILINKMVIHVPSLLLILLPSPLKPSKPLLLVVNLLFPLHLTPLILTIIDPRYVNGNS